MFSVGPSEGTGFGEAVEAESLHCRSWAWFSGRGPHQLVQPKATLGGGSCPVTCPPLTFPLLQPLSQRALLGSFHGVLVELFFNFCKLFTCDLSLKTHKLSSIGLYFTQSRQKVYTYILSNKNSGASVIWNSSEMNDSSSPVSCSFSVCLVLTHLLWKKQAPLKHQWALWSPLNYLGLYFPLNNIPGLSNGTMSLHKTENWAARSLVIMCSKCQFPRSSLFFALLGMKL